ncbi:MAG: COG1361 S-layer family protein [Candidatus Aenigmarchaeota archaeon]|nr:COG1361 S-layer family protein [Candidatus Aenigmarchaeota archaeon]
MMILGIGTVSAAEYDVSLLNQNPDPAKAGEMLDIRFMVENTGGYSANNIEFELVPAYPFMSVPGEDYVRTVSLSPYQTGSDAVNLKYTVRIDKDAIKGVNEIELKRTDPNGVSVTESYDIDVSGSEFAQILYIDKAILVPGNETPLKFTLTNVGTSPLQNVVFSWNEGNGAILPVYSDDTKYIPYVDVGESVVLEYKVVADINADPGLYQIDLSLEYETAEGTGEMNTKAGIFIGGETDFDVTFSESSNGQLSLSVSNVGNNPALSVTVRIPQQDEFTVSGSSSSIIGNLDRGDYTIVSFTVSSSNFAVPDIGMNQSMTRFPRNMDAAMNTTRSFNGNELEVLIEYTDTTGARHVLEKTVPVELTGSVSTTTASGVASYRQNSNSGYYMYGIYAAMIIVVVIAYKKRKAIMAKVKKTR